MNQQNEAPLLEGRHRYYLLNRPRGIGCQPHGVVEKSEIWMPKRDLPTEAQHLKYNPTSFGWIDYEEGLTPEEIWRYELHPHDEIECILYRFWLDARDSSDDPDDWNRIADGEVAKYMELARNEQDRATGLKMRDPHMEMAVRLIELNYEPLGF